MMKEDLKIVVLDGYTLNPGDLSWKDLEALGTVKIYDRTHPGEVVERATGAQIVLTNKTVLDGEALSQLPDLKYIGVLATGYNVVNLEAARRQGNDFLRLFKTGIVRGDNDFIALLYRFLCHQGAFAFIAVAAGAYYRNYMTFAIQDLVNGIQHIFQGIRSMGIVHNGGVSLG